MDFAEKNKPINQPKTMAELLPEICGILSEEAVKTLTSKKQPRSTIVQSRTAEKVIKPMTIAEMRADIMSLSVQPSRKFAQPTASMKKRNWNSSVKVENKNKSHTADGQMKYSSVRKVLNFQPKAKPSSIRATMLTSETPKFPKPEPRAKKSLHIQSKTDVRISGVFNIPQTPITSIKINTNRYTMHQHVNNQKNKENNSNIANIDKKIAVPKPYYNHKRLVTLKPETPLSNISFKSNSDASFLEKEKEINDIEEKIKALTEESTLENIAEVSPPVSTPFKEYRNVQEFFNHTAESDNSGVCNDTVTCFEKNSMSNKCKREESVILSLCDDMLNKATVNTSDKVSTELDDLLEVENQTEKNIIMIENSIKTLNHIKESQIKSLQSVRKLINEKKMQKVSESEKDITMVQIITERKNEPSPVNSSDLSRPSVIKVKSPSYKIPKKNLCLRKKVFHKSVPNVSDGMQTPKRDTNKALSMYMQMKENMNFLTTPLVKHHSVEPTDTPALTSHNLQRQLDKLFNGS